MVEEVEITLLEVIHMEMVLLVKVLEVEMVTLRHLIFRVVVEEVLVLLEEMQVMV